MANQNSQTSQRSPVLHSSCPITHKSVGSFITQRPKGFLCANVLMSEQKDVFLQQHSGAPTLQPRTEELYSTQKLKPALSSWTGTHTKQGEVICIDYHFLISTTNSIYCTFVLQANPTQIYLFLLRPGLFLMTV